MFSFTDPASVSLSTLSGVFPSDNPMGLIALERVSSTRGVHIPLDRNEKGPSRRLFMNEHRKNSRRLLPFNVDIQEVSYGVVDHSQWVVVS